jgi:hypothetical protein
VDGVCAVHMNEAADTDDADESGVRFQNLKGGGNRSKGLSRMHATGAPSGRSRQTEE